MVINYEDGRLQKYLTRYYFFKATFGEEHKPKLSDPEKLYAKTSLSRTRKASKD